MELSEPSPSLNHVESNLELQSSSLKADLEPPPSDLDYTAVIEAELRILDLREAEERDSIKEDEEDDIGEESEIDDKTKSETEVKNENEDETEYGDHVRQRYPYPVRPEAEDCAYYMKTGTCKFGSNCKFNHPVRRKIQASKEKDNEGEELTDWSGQGQGRSQLQSQNQSQIECKYYLRTGGCKFGNACRYKHMGAKSTVVPILELNFLGLPIRPGEKECPYYMRNGSCKYAADCRFNHPDPTAVGGSDYPFGYSNGVTVSSQAASQASLGSWSSPRALSEPASFVPMMYSPTRGVHSQSSEWNGYQASLYPPERIVHSSSAFVMNNPVIDTNASTSHQPQMLIDEFPQRPGQPDCNYFMKTGDCKYKSNCKYNHPKYRKPKLSPCTLSHKGLPLRPDQNICSHYSRYGICKFGPACKFDHPIHITASSAEYELDSPPSSGSSASRQETGIAGSGDGYGSDNSIQQPL